MTTAGYTHVLIPTSLHSVLKDKAKSEKIAIHELIRRGVIGDSSPEITNLSLCQAEPPRL